MKKLTPDRRKYLKRIEVKRYWQRLARNPRKKSRLSKKTRRPNARAIKLVAPVVFSLGAAEHRDALMLFLGRLQDNVRIGRRAFIVFDKTNQLYPCGTLLFVAVLSCLLKRYPGMITSNYPADPVVEQLFQHIGMLDRLGNTKRVAITADNVRHWYFLEGTTGDVSDLKDLIRTYFPVELKESTKAGLFEGMSEAIINTVQHAYVGHSGETTEENEKRWWMFSQQKEGKLSIVVCDLGIGIPKSLRQKFPDYFRHAFGKKRRHTQFIDIAARSSRSRTSLPHRGKGLPDMLEFVKGGDVGGFLIYSLRGAFLYNAKDGREVGHDFSTGIPGTLIQWTVPLNSTGAII